MPFSRDYTDTIPLTWFIDNRNCTITDLTRDLQMTECVSCEQNATFIKHRGTEVLLSDSSWTIKSSENILLCFYKTFKE